MADPPEVPAGRLIDVPETSIGDRVQLALMSLVETQKEIHERIVGEKHRPKELTI